MEGQDVIKTKKSRAKYEVVVILLIIITAVVVAFGISRVQSKAEKGKLMIAELDQMRSAVTTYVTLNKSNPSDLQVLTTMKYSFAPGDAPKSYLSNIEVGKDGKLVDPFGNPYLYDAKTGWVSSSTPGHEKW